MLPTYKEDINVVDTTFEGLFKTNYPKDKFIVVMTGEERDKDRYLRVSEEIENKYQGKFLTLFITMHPNNLPDEMPGKGSNTNWAGWQIKKVIDERAGIKDTYVSVRKKSHNKRLTVKQTSSNHRVHSITCAVT